MKKLQRRANKCVQDPREFLVIEGSPLESSSLGQRTVIKSISLWRTYPVQQYTDNPLSRKGTMLGSVHICIVKTISLFHHRSRKMEFKQ